jgi:hypothetical protein
LEEAGDNRRMLLNLRRHMSRIRVFDPARGSGNFLVIAYKEMRGIEAEINKRRVEPGRCSDIPLTNFRGIEFRDFPAEIARLALIIAEYQCDVLYRGQKEALAEFLPLEAENWITCGNALRLDWLSICPPVGTGVNQHADDLFHTPLNQAQIDFENQGEETYICGNPPHYGSRKQNRRTKVGFGAALRRENPKMEVAWLCCKLVLEGKEFVKCQPSTFAFVCPSSNCEGLQISVLWQSILLGDAEILFAYRPFKWSNLAAHHAVVGVSNIGAKVEKRIFDGDQVRVVSSISTYLLATPNVFVKTEPNPLSELSPMITGSMSRGGGHLIFLSEEAERLTSAKNHSHDSSGRDAPLPIPIPLHRRKPVPTAKVDPGLRRESEAGVSS